ncbi:hypothetical protein OC834_006454 [Tilletia horrida]|uniref:Uncharacterized protein n=1 Tax=Tilletia horrida TaxID=155126 RepID=A0AAN6GC58_9BASI|nr:hypothetical protein OC834_006454 [Tilletia horrida]KAK0525553.1 hypothetical protein OC835_005571 [Tilletia horrida]KAK0528971.1 hypothetical protein OC842_004388 [Tilletia horrida]KAK0563722.1 hypothetical protein OC844_002060 [Tilletia horrida]
MFFKPSFAAAALVSAATLAVADYDPANMPAKTDPSHGQIGYNDCIQRYGASNSKALCQNVYINSVKDFCLWAPRYSAQIGDQEAETISYCMKSGYGTRLIPDGTIKGVQFLKTPSFVQVTGLCDCTKINVAPRDEGGELDPHGATGAGNPVGGVVFTRAFSANNTFQQIHEWSNFMAYNEFSMRACIGPNAKKYCPHIYDLQGSEWNHPGRYQGGLFEQCDAVEGPMPGRYTSGTSTSVFHQGDGSNPPGQAPGASSNCREYASISTGPAAYTPIKSSTSKAAASSTSTKKSTSTTTVKAAAKTSAASAPSKVQPKTSAAAAKVRRHHLNRQHH